MIAFPLVLALLLAACGTRASDEQRNAAAARRGQTATPGPDTGTATPGPETGAGPTEAAPAAPDASATPAPISAPAASASKSPAAASAAPKATGSQAKPTPKPAPSSAAAPARPGGPQAQPGQTPGAGGGAAPAPSPGGSCPGAGTVKDPLVVGGTFPLSGPVGFLGKQELASMDSWVRTRGGGVCGRPIQIVALDDGMDPSRQLANMRKLNEQNKVLLAATILTVGVGDYVTRANLPVLAMGGAIEPFSSKQPTVFPALGSAYQFTGAFIDGLLKAGAVKPGMKIGLLYDTTIFNLAPIAKDLAAQWEKAGMKVVSLDPFNLSDGDCTSLLLKVRQAGIDYWDFQGFGWTLCVAAAQRQGWKPPAGWGGWTTSSAYIPELAGQSADGVWFGGTHSWSPEYEQAMKRFHPEQAKVEADLGAPPAVGIWVLLEVLKQAVEKYGPGVTREQVLSYYRGLKELDWFGTKGPISFDPACKDGTVPGPQSGFQMGQWIYNAGTKRFDRKFTEKYITGNPYIGKCDASKLASERY
jgi:ABC-type branched-subunit amino acid transport system substrate-binding protein